MFCLAFELGAEIPSETRDLNDTRIARLARFPSKPQQSPFLAWQPRREPFVLPFWEHPPGWPAGWH